MRVSSGSRKRKERRNVGMSENAARVRVTTGVYGDVHVIGAARRTQSGETITSSAGWWLYVGERGTGWLAGGWVVKNDLRKIKYKTDAHAHTRVK